MPAALHRSGSRLYTLPSRQKINYAASVWKSFFFHFHILKLGKAESPPACLPACLLRLIFTSFALLFHQNRLNIFSSSSGSGYLGCRMNRFFWCVLLAFNGFAATLYRTTRGKCTKPKVQDRVSSSVPRLLMHIAWYDLTLGNWHLYSLSGLL